jgi:hypothetical protein
MGEKFAANPVMGTGSMTVPLVTSPGRSGFGPQLSISYDSGAGNGPFGFGWALALPQITRKTDKGLPRYDDAADVWLFEVVFDYGEHAPLAPNPGDAGDWAVRNDPFSTYRPGFEVRTYRLCRRVLMFHHFPAEEGVGADCLVRSTDFTYSPEQAPAPRSTRFTPAWRR